MIAQEEATQSVTGDEPQENIVYQYSTSFRLSLQIRTDEGLSIRGDANMQKATTIPQRASKPVTPDIEQEYDDTLGSAPRSAVRIRSTPPSTSGQKSRTTGPIVAPVTTRRVSGGTRFLLWVVLVLCVAFLINGLVVPALVSFNNQLRYGDAKIATYDLNSRHWLTEENNGRVRIVIGSADGSHTQVLTTVVGGVANHALVTLNQHGTKIDVSINNIYIDSLVPDANNGYRWGNN